MHFGLADRCDNPKCGLLGSAIFDSGGLRSRYPLKIQRINSIICLSAPKKMQTKLFTYLCNEELGHLRVKTDWRLAQCHAREVIFPKPFDRLWSSHWDNSFDVTAPFDIRSICNTITGVSRRGALCYLPTDGRPSSMLYFRKF